MRGYIDNLGLRRVLTLAFLVVLVVGLFTAKDTFTSSGQKAQAGSCFTQSANWNLHSGKVGITIGTARFGATICLENGQISSVSPFLNGGIEGAGTPAGFDFSNQGAWVVRQTANYVDVRGQSKVKECLPGLHTVVCSLTDTETYTLRYYTVYGPYAPGTQPGIFTSSRTCSLSGGCYPAISFVRR